jgi:hypothetical protein
MLCLNNFCFIFVTDVQPCLTYSSVPLKRDQLKRSSLLPVQLVCLILQVFLLFECFPPSPSSFYQLLFSLFDFCFEALLSLTVGAGTNSHEIMEETHPELCRILSVSDQSKMPAVCLLRLFFFSYILGLYCML